MSCAPRSHLASGDRDRDGWSTNPSASTAAVLLQLHDRDFLSSSFAKERLPHSFALDSFVRNQASVRESKKNQKTQVDFTGGGGSFATFELCCVRPCQNFVYFNTKPIAFLAPISWLPALVTSPKVVRFRKNSIAFLASISWPATLATSPKLGRLQKIFKKINRISRAKISWPATIATSPKLFRFRKSSIAFLASKSWLATLATSPKLGQHRTNFNCISRANIVTSDTRNIWKAWSTSKKNSIPFFAPTSWLPTLPTSPKLKGNCTPKS